MDMQKVITEVDQLLKSVGFSTFSFDFASIQDRSSYCYDLLVKNANLNLVFIVKIFMNIDNINTDIIDGIKTLSKLFKSKPLLIGMRNRYQKLEDNTIYLREDLPIISLKTLENILKKDLFPYVFKKRGGGVIFFNGDLVKKIREEKRFSRKELSEKIGVTKRTICSYESENMRPSKEIAEKVKTVLGADSRIFRNINVFDWHFEFNITEVSAKEEEELSDFESHIKNVIEDIGISSYWFKKGQFPFEMLISSNKWDVDDFYPLLSDTSEFKKKVKELNLTYLKNLMELFAKKALFIVNNDIKINKILPKSKIPVIKIKSLEKIDDEDQFKRLIQNSESKNSQMIN
ncbi:MAG: putative HTH-type transcriptional regulatory protein [Promethearchaeota archaeon]|nr:MAG: putative HTH-type transcriptional regulatory protein [Candidatus Lokiarchaeota archaeon]